MKIFNSIKILSFILLLGFTSFVSCDYLDVVPPEQPDLSDATKDYESTQRFLYSCYAGITNPMGSYSGVEAASDEWVLPPLWSEGMHRMLYNLNTPTSVSDGWRWGNNYYRFIGQSHLFKEQLPNATFLSEAEMTEWQAEADFLIAYYHMQVLTQYGPCPINDHYIPMDTDPADYPGRSHFDYVVDYIVNKFDEVAEILPAKREQEKWGRATSTMAKALKARLLVYAASPLWNGEFPYPEWENKNFETPGYGKELVSTVYDKKKWEVAKIAALEALNFATNEGGSELYRDEELHIREGIDLPFVPGVNAETPEGKAFLKKVLLMRYLVTTRVTEGNKEIIWGLADQGSMVIGSLPHGIMKLNNGTDYSGYSGVSPVLNTSVEYFYTKNGKRPEFDSNFADKSLWFKSAGVSGRSDIITLNVEREPRFYAWFAFDGGDYSSKIVNGEPLKIELRNGDKQGFNPNKFNRDNNTTGYFSQKYVMPKYAITTNGSNNGESKPRPMIRLAEVYLNLAEAYAELGETDNAIHVLNIIRNRAGVPDLEASDITSQMTLVDWVRNERFIELWGEGHRYYDVRRWMEAPNTMGQNMRTGLNAYGKINPTFEEFNTPISIDQPFVWSNRMYLLPVFNNEVYKNPQMIQAPGYN